MQTVKICLCPNPSVLCQAGQLSMCHVAIHTHAQSQTLVQSSPLAAIRMGSSALARTKMHSPRPLCRLLRHATCLLDTMLVCRTWCIAAVHACTGLASLPELLAPAAPSPRMPAAFVLHDWYLAGMLLHAGSPSDRHSMRRRAHCSLLRKRAGLCIWLGAVWQSGRWALCRPVSLPGPKIIASQSSS